MAPSNDCSSNVKHMTRVSYECPRHQTYLLLHFLSTGWPLSRHCKIPWQSHDISLTVRGTPVHVKCYSYHAGKCKCKKEQIRETQSQKTARSPNIVKVLVVGVGMQQCTIRNPNEMYKFSKVKNGRKYAANNKVSVHFSDTPWHFPDF